MNADIKTCSVPFYLFQNFVDNYVGLHLHAARARARTHLFGYESVVNIGSLGEWECLDRSFAVT